MSSVTRRSFVSSMGMGAAAMAALAAGSANITSALADNDSIGIPDEKALGEVDIVTPPERESLGESTMTLEELNRRRKELVDSRTEDWVCEDGTVIPNVYVKLRTLVHTYGIGIGNDMTDACFDFWTHYFTPEEAQFYLDLPWGKKFQPIDAVATTGKDLDYCLETLSSLAERGVLMPTTIAGNQYYHQMAFLQGSCEATLKDIRDDPATYLTNMGSATTDTGDRIMYNAASFYYAIPCDRSVVSSGEIDPYDDWEMKIKSKNNFAISPCYCKTCSAAGAGMSLPEWGSEEWKDAVHPTTGHPLQTCLLMGADADFMVQMGLATPITQEEALETIRRQAEMGFMIESYYSKNSEVICSCHVQDCGHLKYHKVIPVETYEDAVCRANTSHFNLVYDKDVCIKCGACAERCPMESITMGEDGYPQVDAHCFRCGQCAMVCPAHARSLAAKPKEEWGFLPDTISDDDNNKAAWRFEHGLIW